MVFLGQHLLFVTSSDTVAVVYHSHSCGRIYRLSSTQSEKNEPPKFSRLE